MIRKSLSTRWEKMTKMDVSAVTLSAEDAEWVFDILGWEKDAKRK